MSSRAQQRSARGSKRSRSYDRPATGHDISTTYHRRLLCEMLEDRCLLSTTTISAAVLSYSPARTDELAVFASFSGDAKADLRNAISNLGLGGQITLHWDVEALQDNWLLDDSLVHRKYYTTITCSLKDNLALPNYYAVTKYYSDEKPSSSTWLSLNQAVETACCLGIPSGVDSNPQDGRPDGAVAYLPLNESSTRDNVFVRVSMTSDSGGIWNYNSDWTTAYYNWGLADHFPLLDTAGDDFPNQVRGAQAWPYWGSSFSGVIGQDGDVDVIGKDNFVAGTKYRFTVTGGYTRFRLTGPGCVLDEEGLTTQAITYVDGVNWLWDCDSDATYYMVVSASAPCSYTLSVTVVETEPPEPSPSTWFKAPYATGATSIAMYATAAEDPNGVEYYFDETSGNPGGSDSGWRSSRYYEDTGLSPNTQYTYTVKTRDKSLNPNIGKASIPASATTNATTPPAVLSHSEYTYVATDVGVTFTEDMNDSTFTNATVTVNGSISGSHACDFAFNHETHVLTINPRTDLASGESVTVRLSGVTNLAGIALAAPYQFSFNIAARNWNVSVGNGPHGTVTPSGILTLAEGSNQTFTATPDAGYIVDTWYVDGSPVQPHGNTYLLANIRADLDVAVTFEPGTTSSQITLTSPNGGQTYAIANYVGIYWDALQTGGAVKVELYKGGVPQTPPIDPSNTKGSCTWQVPDYQTPGNDYRIRVTSLSTGQCDESDADFTIGPRVPSSTAPRTINNAAELYALSANWSDGNHPIYGYYILTCDIDASVFSGQGLKPIGLGTNNTFRGVFDGQGHTISNLRMNWPTFDNVGLFSKITSQGVIKNLNVAFERVDGQNCTGALAGVNEGTIQNCHVSVKDGYKVNGYGHEIGGLVGENLGVIENCSFAGTVYGRLATDGSNPFSIGGIAGCNFNNAVIQWCHASGSVSDYGADGDAIGGIAGENSGLRNVSSDLRQLLFEISVVRDL